MTKFVNSGDLPAHLYDIVNALRNGELVVVPTETVYGLAALASDAAAVSKIFQAKARPSNNPLIVHCANLEQVKTLAKEWTESAQALADAFWPGPLTLVVPCTDDVPSVITAGGPTVALRIPNNPFFSQILTRTGPLAAPSANPSNRISPTRVSHLAQSILEHVSYVVDDGACEMGIESTVVRATETLEILRPGAVTKDQLQEVIPVICAPEVEHVHAASPGLQPNHYSALTATICVEEFTAIEGRFVAVVYSTGNVASGAEQVVRLPCDRVGYAREFYDGLHKADSYDLDVIVIEAPPKSWTAVWDRITRATDLIG